MRIIVPEEISALARIIFPFMELDKKKKAFVLRDDAPQNVKEANKRYQNWFMENVTRK